MHPRTHSCSSGVTGPTDQTRPIRFLSHEHSKIELFGEHDVPELVMPTDHKRVITTWFERLRRPAPEMAG